MKKIALFTIYLIFICVGKSFSEPTDEHVWTLDEHVLGVGTEMSYIMYDEPNVMEEEGMMYGITGSYAHHGDIMLKGEAKFSSGQVDYKNSGTIDNIDDYMLEFRGLVGYDFVVRESHFVTPYIGFGYRYLNDDSSGMTSSTGAMGYEREANYFYTPIGIEITTPLDNVWSIGVVLEYDHFWKGVQKSHLSDVNPSFSDLENDQNEGFGFRSSLKLQKRCENLDLIIEPFIRYWNVKESETDDITFNGALWGFGWEPKNTSTEVGIKLVGIF